MVKAVIFDMYETLVTMFRCPGYKGADIARDIGIPEAKFREVWDTSDSDRTLGLKSFEEVIRYALEINDRYSDELFEKIVEKRKKACSDYFKYQDPEIIPMLSELKKRQIKIALISNCYFEERDVIKNCELYKYFDVTCLSCEEGIKKPDRRIYDKCLAKLGLEAGECLYIGDGGSSELEVAAGLGMQTAQAVWYLREGLKQPSGRKPDFRQPKTPLAVLKMISEEQTTLVFTGDIGFDHYMEGRFRDEEFLDEGVLNFFGDADHVIANVEGALSSGEHRPGATSVLSMMHSMDPEVSGFLRKIGADVWSLANNHIMDAGPEGLEDTLNLANENHVSTIGAGRNLSEAAKPLILEEAGGIGMFAVGYQRGCRKAGEDTPGCLSWSDMETIRETICAIKDKCRWCIVVAHGGEEFTSLPSPYTRQRYLDYLDMGADLVVCHHPHVPMNYETVGSKMIFYSLGNFVFDTDYQRAQFNTEKGVLLKLRFTRDTVLFEPFGIEIDRTSERIVSARLPKIFREVPEKEYELLLPLSAGAFLEATKRQQIYLKPDRYSEETTEEQWMENFMEEKRSGRVPGEALDLQIICPIARQAEEEKWKESSLEDVKEYILEQMQSNIC